MITLTSIELKEKLVHALNFTDQIIIPIGVDEKSYLADLRTSLISARLDSPEWVTAVVESPGFANRQNGELIGGYLLAESDGYWLVYAPDDGQYYCFWGVSKDCLGAHGIVGHPLYCWWA
jgi:hypothetical protein